MAIIGKFHSLKWAFSPLPSEIYDYIAKALSPTHPINHRIRALNSVGEAPQQLDYGVRAIEQAYHLKAPSRAFFETHRKFVDIQLVVEGYEYMYIGDRGEFEVSAPYSEERDLVMYRNDYAPHLHEGADSQSKLQNLARLYPLEEEGCAPMRTRILLRAGDMAIFIPDDVHAGGLELTPKAPIPSNFLVKKSVLKVPYSLFR